MRTDLGVFIHKGNGELAHDERGDKLGNQKSIGKEMSGTDSVNTAPMGQSWEGMGGTTRSKVERLPRKQMEEAERRRNSFLVKHEPERHQREREFGRW